MEFAKGHGTENGFVIIEDFNASNILEPQRVAALCDRRAGIGGDGLLRVVRAGALVEAGELAELSAGIAADDWFMDYRNADGSVAEMCGNGTRVFAHWLRSRGLVDSDEFVVGTRAGAKPVRVSSFNETDAEVTVEMGPVEVTGLSTAVMGGVKFAGLAVDVGNPHLAAVIPGLTPEDLGAMEFAAPQFDGEFFPQGVNVEVLTPLVDGATHMRVFERGVGETRSCGTGTVATAVAALADAAQHTGTVQVRVSGGQVEVEIREDGTSLTGPSKIVAVGQTSL
ncbi:diaminopimelate epimerase [Corynebacterium phocae]|uniref:Diaminopimelate epimerase n=1 Tax=Corynebacterium phocae TaxID=161895 RepID=A0A1L7D2R7_9CORY|nr:diaminopimelate epimerase [Corynebacterium phocae]APT92373.1 diaminopimelate epimerase [Corynebacterium phocae]KAA8724964.1 diaminopimelate epimerase [Corynebacterium phocae]